MQIVIIGAAGMIGRKLTGSLLAEPPAGLDRLTLVDAIAPEMPAGAPVPVTAERLDVTDRAAVEALVACRRN